MTNSCLVILFNALVFALVMVKDNFNFVKVIPNLYPTMHIQKNWLTAIIYSLGN